MHVIAYAMLRRLVWYVVLDDTALCLNKAGNVRMT